MGRCSAAGRSIAAGGRVGSAAVGGSDVHAIDVDTAPQFIEWRRAIEVVNKCLGVGVILVHLASPITLAENHHIPALVGRAVVNNFGCADHESI